MTTNHIKNPGSLEHFRFASLLLIPFLLMALTASTDGMIFQGNNPGGPALNISYHDDPGIIYFVDGIAVTAGEVDKLSPDEIEQMEFIQDKEQIRKYTGKEVNTVVLITLKKKDDKRVEENGD